MFVGCCGFTAVKKGEGVLVRDGRSSKKMYMIDIEGMGSDLNEIMLRIQRGKFNTGQLARPFAELQ